ncbi:zeaxanthin 7,8(7',8')-cleavage dioxygenase, chromoplastic [Canna indica]|uniref:Zeaxanthin 7,8(7',8')-cleavage dioxygenase, chromoplastic n=1 Tax=Canna indica TaxID=4628 RepID=A0AAQ3K979_9LILI|nr:zeaxanthin 7,8(7',8')-cleavage dioxygenase, chromoplastic [Canna indica]
MASYVLERDIKANSPFVIKMTNALSFPTSSSNTLPAASRRLRLLGPSWVLSPPPSSSSSPRFLSISAVRIEEKTQTAEPQNKTTSNSATTIRTTPPQVNNTGPIKVNKQPAERISRRPQPAARPRSPPSLQATFCNALDDLIHNFIDPPVLRPSVDPRYVLADNFAPVDELPPTPCPVVRGAIPRCLAGGAYIRNGPNPQHLPRGTHHLFDGDGMLHSLLLPSGSDGTAPATLCSRYVRTYKYLLERDAGAPVLPNVFAGFYGAAGLARGAVSAARVLTGQMNPTEGVGLANTSLAFFGNHLYALGESDLPYAVRVSQESGDIATLGRCDFDGQLFMGMTAHPKKDPVTGELFAFRYGPVPPFVTYFRFDSDGNKSGPDVPIFSVRQASFLHDFAISERYAIFPDIQIVMKPMDMVLGGGMPVGSDHGKVPRIGVIPRYATSEAEMRWYEVPGFNPVHALNAWEEDGDLVLVAPNVLSVEHALGRMELVHSCMEMVRIDLRGGAVSRTPLSAANIDFGVMHPGYLGRKNRYAYLGVGDPQPKISGVVKLDMALAGKGDCVVAQREYGPGCYGGEAFFVAKGEREGEEEDEGYLVSYVHNEASGESRFVVMDAQSPGLDIVAEVLLPRRVPYGFHGLFVTKDELRSQRPL